MMMPMIISTMANFIRAGQACRYASRLNGKIVKMKQKHNVTADHLSQYGTLTPLNPDLDQIDLGVKWRASGNSKEARRYTAQAARPCSWWSRRDTNASGSHEAASGLGRL